VIDRIEKRLKPEMRSAAALLSLRRMLTNRTGFWKATMIQYRRSGSRKHSSHLKQNHIRWNGWTLTCPELSFGRLAGGANASPHDTTGAENIGPSVPDFGKWVRSDSEVFCGETSNVFCSERKISAVHSPLRRLTCLHIGFTHRLPVFHRHTRPKGWTGLNRTNSMKWIVSRRFAPPPLTTDTFLKGISTHLELPYLECVHHVSEW